MPPDMTTVKETSGLVKAIWPWVRKLFDFRKRLEKSIDIDVASGSEALRVDLGSTTHAIDVCLKVSNFSPIFSVKIERVTGSIMMRGKTYKQVVSNESISAADRIPHGQSRFVYYKFKMSDSQVRGLREFNQYLDLEAKVEMRLEISSCCGTICKSNSERYILVKSWYQPPDI